MAPTVTNSSPYNQSTFSGPSQPISPLFSSPEPVTAASLQPREPTPTQHPPPPRDRDSTLRTHVPAPPRRPDHHISITPPSSPPANSSHFSSLSNGYQSSIRSSVHSKTMSIASAYSQASTAAEVRDYPSQLMRIRLSLLRTRQNPLSTLPPHYHRLHLRLRQRISYPPRPQLLLQTYPPPHSSTPLASPDGETGIGLSLLQNLADNESAGEWSDSESDRGIARRNTVRQKQPQHQKRGGSIRRRGSKRGTESTPRKKRSEGGSQHGHFTIGYADVDGSDVGGGSEMMMLRVWDTKTPR